MLNVTSDKVVIQLLINIKYIFIVIETGLHFQNMPHSMSLVFCKNNVIDYQYMSEADTYNYI